VYSKENENVTFRQAQGYERQVYWF